MDERSDARGAALVQHYHATYDLTFKLWRERNWAFLLLITTLAIAALISYDPAVLNGQHWSLPGLGAPAAAEPGERNTFLLTVLCYWAQEEDCGPASDALRHFSARFPHDAFDGIISIIVLYLMLNITNLSSTIVRYYTYINRLEVEIRRELDIRRWQVAFAREGGFYQSLVLPMQLKIRYFYVVILLAMLALYFGVRLAAELHPSGSLVRLIGHAVIAALALLAWFGYARVILGKNEPREDFDAAQHGA